MATPTRKVFATAALVVTTFATTAMAGTVFPTDQSSYAHWRVAAVFNVVAMMPEATPVSVPLAQKGDLEVPLGCNDTSADTQAECMDVAYEPDSLPSVIIETRVGTTSTLLRMEAMTVAGVVGETLLQSE